MFSPLRRCQCIFMCLGKICIFSGLGRQWYCRESGDSIRRRCDFGTWSHDDSSFDDCCASSCFVSHFKARGASGPRPDYPSRQSGLYNRCGWFEIPGSSRLRPEFGDAILGKGVEWRLVRKQHPSFDCNSSRFAANGISGGTGTIEGRSATNEQESNRRRTRGQGHWTRGGW